MNKLKKKLRAIVAIAMMLIVGFSANAFKVDGIYYNITSSVEPYTVEVASSNRAKFTS